MHVALPCRVGSLISAREVLFCGIKSLIEIRKIHDSYVTFIVDDVPSCLSALDPEYVQSLIVSRGLTVRKAVEKACKDLGINVETELAEAVFLRWSRFYGSLTPLLLTDEVTDVYVSVGGVRAMHVAYGLTDVKVEFPSHDVKSRSPFRRGTLRLDFDQEKFVRFVVRRVSERARSPITSYMPLLSTTDRELRVRFTTSIEPVSTPYVHARILPRTPWTLSRLIQLDSLSINQAALLWLLFDLKVPILIIGPMGSGKTSLASAITFNSCPDMSKVLIMDVDEICLPGHNVVKLFERRSYGLGIQPITKDLLIAHALRMGVDYIIVNEVRTREEVRAWLDAVTTGHGGVTTFHASNLQTLKLRLENMLDRSVDIDREIVVIKTDQTYAITCTSDGTKVRRSIRRVVDIVIPRSLKISRDDVNIRASLLSKIMGLSVEQQLSVLYQFYREPDKVLESLV